MKITIFTLLIFLASCAKHYPAPVTEARYKSVSSTPTQDKVKPKYITVNKGDTLYSIGFSYNMDYKYLAKINNIPAPYRIHPGQKLRLKARKTSVANTNTAGVQTTPIKIKQPMKHIVNNDISSKPTTKPTTINVKPIIKPQITVKPINKPNNKPIVKKPIKKPIEKPVVLAHTPSSNSHWVWPVSGKVISTFSITDIARKGIDIAVPVGKPVYASNNGTVVYSGDGLLGYGELIIIKHDNNLLSAYANNSSRLVKEGVAVKQGQQIAKSGQGNDGRGLLHFEIRKNGKPVNPLKYLPK
ncbi:MAG: peptidoglycan DD-metalloendopeptidase family protein [Proteobacteria bacterium]|nr:peptidoglycan DD-metalloendopeptidase family protein [Pseudomonadota bacterium]